MARASDDGEEGIVFENRMTGAQKTIPFPAGLEVNSMDSALKVGRFVKGIPEHDRIGVRYQAKFEVLQN